MPPHQFVPDPRGFTVATADQNQLHRPQLPQPAADPSNLHGPLRWFSGLAAEPLPRATSSCRQHQLTLLLQTPQRQPATHLLPPTVGRPPVQPLANPSRQAGPRQLRLFGHGPPNSGYHLVTELLPANPHKGNLQFHHPLCPAKKMWDTIRPAPAGVKALLSRGHT